MVTPTPQIDQRARPQRVAVATGLAAFTAALGWAALGIEFDRSLSVSFADGHGLAEALFLYLRFFTILTNIGIATLMSISALRLATHRPLPGAAVFNAGLIYILVTCVTYELLLRTLWHPHGLQLFTDSVIHDVVPALTLAFWLAFAPRDGARWRDALWMLVYPAAYFTATLIAGALGEGYPYDFLDVDKLGYASVFVIGLIFVAVFYGLGLATTGFAIARAPERRRRAMDARRTMVSDQSSS